MTISCMVTTQRRNRPVKGASTSLYVALGFYGSQPAYASLPSAYRSNTATFGEGFKRVHRPVVASF